MPCHVYRRFERFSTSKGYCQSTGSLEMLVRFFSNMALPNPPPPPKKKQALIEHASMVYVYIKSEPLALTGDKSEGVKSWGVVLLSYTRELSRPFKGNKWITTVSEEQEPPGLRQTTAAGLVLRAHPYLSVIFPPAFVESQMAQMDRLRILEWGALSSSSVCGGSFVVVFTFFLIKVRT